MWPWLCPRAPRRASHDIPVAILRGRGSYLPPPPPPPPPPRQQVYPTGRRPAAARALDGCGLACGDFVYKSILRQLIIMWNASLQGPKLGTQQVTCCTSHSYTRPGSSSSRPAASTSARCRSSRSQRAPSAACRSACASRGFCARCALVRAVVSASYS